MMRRRRASIALLFLAKLAVLGWLGPLAAQPVRFSDGARLVDDPAFFPLAVWLQNPRNALYYRAIGINTFVGLWKGPTEQQLAALADSGLHVIAEQNDVALASRHARVIRAWMQIDEPDNAQPNALGVHGDCLMPDEIVARYRALKARDPTRPVFLNFGQGVANLRWHGRGAKCAALDHEAYYAAAAKGADILSFDIYPIAEARQEHVKGRLELVAEGVARLARWAAPHQSVWNAIETTHIHSPSRRPLGAEIRAEVWMSIIHGSRGIIYFVHEWQPSFREDAIFRYPDAAAAVAQINAEIMRLAPVINGPAVTGLVEIDSAVRIATSVRRHDGRLYLFAVNMERRPARARFRLAQPASPVATVLGEDRSLTLEGSVLSDDFAPYGVHLYRIGPPG